MAGDQPARSAYVAKNERTFHSVKSVVRADSRMPSSEMRLAVHGDPFEKKYQRTASEPWRAKISHASATLPRDFDIFWPSASTTSPRHTTLRYGVDPNTSVLTASRE